MHTTEISFPTELISKIVRCVENAVGDDIREDIQNNDLHTKNSIPFRIWDLINRNIIQALNTENCTVADAHRGPWEMLVIFERSTRCILTFMREKRFTELRKRQRQRAHMHYIDMLTRQFNKNLLSNQQQLCFIPHSFSDEDHLAELVQTLLHDLGGESEIVRHHVLVLFDTIGYQLTSIRAVMVTPSLEIAQNGEQDWSQYITAAESIIVEKVSEPSAPQNQPNRGLTLTAKSVARQKGKPEKKEMETDTKQES